MIFMIVLLVVVVTFTDFPIIEAVLWRYDGLLADQAYPSNDYDGIRLVAIIGGMSDTVW